MKKLRFKVLKTTFYKMSIIFDAELVKFKAQCEDLVKKSSIDYSKIIDQLKDGLKSKDHIINKLLTAIGCVTSLELISKIILYIN